MRRPVFLRAPESALKRIILTTLRWAIPLAILAFLVQRLQSAEDAVQWDLQPGDWYLLGFAFVLIVSATTVVIFRWWLLVRTLGISFSLVDAMQLGFIAELLNLIAFGVVGGDVFKAFFIALMCAGDVPQQPPMIFAPASTSPCT